MRILFITLNGLNDPTFGGARASIRNYEALKSFNDISIYHINKKSTFSSFLSLFEGFFPPIRRSDKHAIMELITKQRIEAVFFDHSLFGSIVKTISKIVPTITFYHNCELDYIDVRFLGKRDLKKIIYRHSARKNERLSSLFSNSRIALTERDKNRIEEIYGTNVQYVIPIGIKDDYMPSSNIGEYCLLFGPEGAANNEGFKWFVKNVSPFINCRTVIAGKGMDKQFRNNQNDRVSVLGYVDNLNELYSKALFVAIPLFSGGGMKIKTAEALMYGKTIFGTSEAFVGYDLEFGKVGSLCNSADEFICEINKYINGHTSCFNEYSRNKYLQLYSIEASTYSFHSVINGLSHIN